MSNVQSPTGLRGSFFAAMAPASARKLTAQGISLGDPSPRCIPALPVPKTVRYNFPAIRYSGRMPKD
jgi:hypothetical protein